MKLTAVARNLRHNQTDAEQRLWLQLRSRQIAGVKFRRQQPIGPYIVDFCSLENHLIIELDGSQHMDQSSEDSKRTTYLERAGFRVVRFWNNDVFENLEGVLETIHRLLVDPPHPSPLPQGEREKERDPSLRGERVQKSVDKPQFSPQGERE